VNRPLEASVRCALAGHRLGCRWGDGRVDNSHARRTAIGSDLCAPTSSSNSETRRRSTLFLREEDAQAALEDALRDEPGWASTLTVEPIELDEREMSANWDPRAADVDRRS
jgi:hypothetical protein